MGKRVNYRNIAFDAYGALCAHCGFGIRAVLEVAHIDGSRDNNDPRNLVVLCPNCHKMFDLDLISTQTITEMRDRPKTARWAKRMRKPILLLKQGASNFSKPASPAGSRNFRGAVLRTPT